MHGWLNGRAFSSFLDSHCWAMTVYHRWICFWEVQSAMTTAIHQSEGSSADSINHLCTMYLSCFLETSTKGTGTCWNTESENLSQAWLCGSVSGLSSLLNNLENCRKVFPFTAWAFIWLSRRPKSLFALEQQSFTITHCIKIFSCRCSLLPVTFTQHFNGIQGPLKCRQCVRLQRRLGNVTSQEGMWYPFLGCLEVDMSWGRDAVECNVHIQQLDWAPNAKTCLRKAFAVLLTAISSQMLDLHAGIITLRNSETSGKWDQECNFGCFWLIHWDVVPLSLLVRFAVGLGQL